MWSVLKLDIVSKFLNSPAHKLLKYNAAEYNSVRIQFITGTVLLRRAVANVHAKPISMIYV